MAKVDIDTPFEMSVKQLYDQTKSRKIIPCTLSSDIGLSGGIPLGATVLIGGRPKVGKTTYILQVAANAQRLYGCKIFIFPIEGRLTNQPLEQVRGFDMDKATVVMPPPIYDKEKKIIGYHKWHAQQWWKAIGDTIVKNPSSILIVDSLSSLSSEKEQSEGMGYQGRGDTQKLEAQFCRMYADAIISNQVTVFFIAQVQANTSGYGPALQMKSGNSIRHQADIVMFGKTIENWPEQEGRVRGHDINFTIETSALGAGKIDIAVPLRYGFGIDNIKDIIVNAITWDIIKKKGSWYVIPIKEVDDKLVFDMEIPEDEDGFVKLQGENELWNWFNHVDHQQFIKIIEDAIRRKIFG